MNTTPTADQPTPGNGCYNRAAIKRQAMLVSEKVRNGKFTRCSEEFIDLVIADLEAQIRSMRCLTYDPPLGRVDAGAETFLTGAGKEKLCEVFNAWAAVQIQKRIDNTRVGKTL